MFSENEVEQIRLFKDFTDKESISEFIDIGAAVCTSDDAISDRIISICGAKSVSELQALQPDERSRAIRALREEGVSIRQIVRMTGEPFGLVRRIGR